MKNFNSKTNVPHIDQDLLRQIDSLHLREKHSEVIDIAVEECLDSSCLNKMELREFQEIGFDDNSISQMNWMKKSVILGQSSRNQRIQFGNNVTEKKKYGELLLLGHHGYHRADFQSIGFLRERFELCPKSEIDQQPGVICLRPNLTTNNGKNLRFQEVLIEIIDIIVLSSSG